MAVVSFLSLAISACAAVISILFRVSVKLRLSLPLLYVLAMAVSTLFSDWVSKHESLVAIGAAVLLLISLMSWYVSWLRENRRRKQSRFEGEDILWQIRQASAQGVPLDSATFDDKGSLIDPRTGQPLYYSTGR